MILFGQVNVTFSFELSILACRDRLVRTPTVIVSLFFYFIDFIFKKYDVQDDGRFTSTG